MVRSDVRARLTHGLASTKYLTASSGARFRSSIADARAIFMLDGAQRGMGTDTIFTSSTIPSPRVTGCSI
jgi:hypothetical protein